MESQNKKNKLEDFFKFVIIILAVVALGLFCVNQTLGYIYKAQFLKSPCKLCGDLNPEVESCIININTHPSYPNGLGGWSDPLNRTVYNYSLSLMP